MDVHLFNVGELGVEYVDARQLADLYGDQYANVESALVIESAGTLTAFVCCGTRDEIRDLAHDIVRMIRIQTTHRTGDRT
jgi:hypothetical protein